MSAEHELGPVPEPRRYGQECPVGFALNVLGDRWTLPLLKELQLGGRRFGDIKAVLPGLSANVLSARLAQLEERGLVAKAHLPAPASVIVYELTDMGLETRPLIVELTRCAMRDLNFDLGFPRSASSFAMMLLAAFRPSEANDVDCRVGFTIGKESFVLQVIANTASISKDDLKLTHAQFSGPASALARYFCSAPALCAPESHGAIEHNGARGLVGRLPDLFLGYHTGGMPCSR